MLSYSRLALASLAVGGWLAMVQLSATCRADDAAVAKHRAVAEATLKQLLSALDKRPDGYDDWPPKANIVENAENNAYATIQRADGKIIPIMVVYTGEVEHIAEFNSDVLAFTIGHELGHLVLGHSLGKGPQALATTQVLNQAFSRQQEIDADHFGMEIALKAGFTRAGIIRNLTRSAKYSGNYSSYEGLYVDHPNWTDRIALLDADRANLWRSMGAFDNGVVFLSSEQYASAQLCFERIVKEFPDIGEAWANLGYARLMQYCDALDPDDVRRFDLGQIVIGGFYQRAPQFEATRQIARDLWQPAVDALNQALKLDPNLVLAKGSLAIAYLVAPDGKDAKKAAALFDEIDQQLKDPAVAKQLEDNPAAKLALLINGGVARADQSSNLASINRAWDDLAQQLDRMSNPNRPNPQTVALAGAVEFNRANSLAKSTDNTDRQSAEDLWATYLAQTPTSAVWWPLAYEKYVTVCQELGATPKTKAELAGKRKSTFRKQVGLAIDGKRELTLGTPQEDVVALLGKPDGTTNLVKGTKLQNLDYDSLGLTLTFYDGLVVISLRDEKAPHFKVFGTGVASTPETVYVGMPKAEFEDKFGAQRPFGAVYDPAIQYRFYEELGLGVRFKAGKVAEVVIAPLTRAERKDD